MKLIALITLVTEKGEVLPGSEIEIKDTAEANRLISIGAAKAAAKAAETESQQ